MLFFTCHITNLDGPNAPIYKLGGRDWPKLCLDLEKDFMLGWLSKWANLSQLQRSSKDALDTIHDLFTKQIDEELTWTSNFLMWSRHKHVKFFRGETFIAICLWVGKKLAKPYKHDVIWQLKLQMHMQRKFSKL
jgi:hypothetical protein